MDIKSNIILDFNGNDSKIVVYAKQHDKLSRYIHITPVFNGRKIYTFDDNIVARLELTKPDKHVVLNDCEIKNGIIIAELTEQCLAVAGDAIAEIALYKDEVRLSSSLFKVCIKPNSTAGGIPNSGDEYDTTMNGVTDERINRLIDARIGDFSFETVQPDWQQNDPDAEDYVKGRTHWTEGDVVHQLDEKYIPDTIARTEDIPELPTKLSAFENDKGFLTEADLPEGGGSVQPDWNQNDPDAPDYIKNRFGAYEDFETFVDNSLDFTFYDGNIYGCEFELSLPISALTESIVSFDGIECQRISEYDDELVFGNLSLVGFGDDTGEPFLCAYGDGYFVIYTTSTEDIHHIKIYGIIKKKIDLKWVDSDVLVATVMAKLRTTGLYVPSGGLVYRLDGRGKNRYGRLVSRGNCTDENVYISDKYCGFPVTQIGTGIFANDTNVKSVFIPNGVTYLEGNMFYGCTNLEDVCLPDAITGVAQYTFYGCSKLSTVDLPSSLGNLSWGMFQDCTGLTEITIPASVSRLSEQVFNGCNNLTEIHMLPTTPPNNMTGRTFEGLPSTCTVYVPMASVDDYKYRWSEIASQIVGE